MLGMKVEGVNVYDTTIYYNDFLKELQNDKTKMTKEEIETEFKKIQLPEGVLF